jgi:hypothetical protein
MCCMRRRRKIYLHVRRKLWAALRLRHTVGLSDLFNKRSCLSPVQCGRTNLWQHADSYIRHLSLLAGSCQMIFFFLWVMDFQETIKTVRSSCVLRTFQEETPQPSWCKAAGLAFIILLLLLFHSHCRPLILLIIECQSVDLFEILYFVDRASRRNSG